ncbi:SLAM family member 8-like isoform X2 [Podarcis raffonei]|uniref:SLAM family member 8-like isoform X2 n=1 Tax=Podarcis raffonei TaxID=65483 RepID=UPI0023290EA5|nr:SLAM family member 8-like isoform X2 [Podarcis raffonei]
MWPERLNHFWQNKNTVTEAGAHRKIQEDRKEQESLSERTKDNCSCLLLTLPMSALCCCRDVRGQISVCKLRRSTLLLPHQQTYLRLPPQSDRKVKEDTCRSLKILLVFKLLIYSSFGTLSQAAENPTYHVNGILGGSVFLSLNAPPAKKVVKIEWAFHPTSGDSYLLGEFRDGKLDQSNFRSQYEQQMETGDAVALRIKNFAMVDETTLSIKNLTMKHSGLYEARAWINSALFQEHHFILTVYEPVPRPWIQHKVQSKTPEGCNVSLQCQAPVKEEYTISWKRGNPPRVLVGGLDKYWLSDNGRNLHVSWRKSSSDSTFTCLVSNPVDRNRASFDLLRICASGEGGQQKYWGILPLLVCAVGTSACLIMIWKKKKLGKKKDAASVMQAQEGSPAPLLRGDPPKDGDDQLR